MALSAFDDRSRPPKDDELAAVLGRGATNWNRLKDRVAARCGPVSEVWGWSGMNFGWGLRIKQRERVILYLTPCRGYFLASFALGEKAVEAARESRLPAGVLKAIEDAPKYAEGRGVRFEIRRASDVASIEALAVLKLAH